MNYLKNIVILFSANSLGTLINFISLPILTRIYSPEDFGLLAYFLSISLIFGMFLTLKFENVFFIENNNIVEVYSLIIISITLTSILSLIVLIFFWAINFLIKDFLLIPLLMVYIILLGFYYTGRAYSSSVGNFKKISKGYLVKIITQNLFFLIFGILFAPNYNYLLLGTVLGQLIETIILNSNINLITIYKIINLNTIKEYFYRYINFPKFTLLGELIGNVNSQLPVFFLSNYFGNSVTGHYAMVQRLFAIPLKLLTSSTAEAFRNEAAKLYSSEGSFKNLAIQTSKYLFIIAFVIGTLIIIVGDLFIPLFLGKNWLEAIPFLKVMIILFIFQFSISPISYGLYISEKQKYDFYWQLSLFITCLILLLIGVKYLDATKTILLFNLGYSFMYIIYLFLIISNSEKNNVIK